MATTGPAERVIPRRRAALACAALCLVTAVGASGLPAWASDTPVTGSPAPVLAPADLGGGGPSVPPAAGGIAAKVARLVRAAHLTALVVDPATGDVLLDSRAQTPVMPASTAKLATASAALAVLGPQTRIATVVRSDGDTVYLVGGGDPSLLRTGHQRAGGPASLAELASKAAEALGASRTVRLVYDDHAFRGPALGPAWPAGFPAAGVVPPITALVVDGGRATAGGSSFVADPSRQAADAFARELRDRGVTVSGIGPGSVPAAAAEVARVESAPVSDLVQYMLTESDNAYAESLAHLVGGAELDQPTFRGGAKATRAVLERLGIDVGGFGLVDASGLSRRDRLAATTLVGVLRDVLAGTHDELAYIAPGLAVAGMTGTLANRFTSPSTRPGRGYVQAKTGTLTGVVALAGLVRTRDNGTLAFALVSNTAGSIAGARDTMDTIASRLATCGCG